MCLWFKTVWWDCGFVLALCYVFKKWFTCAAVPLRSFVPIYQVGESWNRFSLSSTALKQTGIYYPLKHQRLTVGTLLIFGAIMILLYTLISLSLWHLLTDFSSLSLAPFSSPFGSNHFFCPCLISTDSVTLFNHFLSSFQSSCLSPSSQRMNLKTHLFIAYIISQWCCHVHLHFSTWLFDSS